MKTSRLITFLLTVTGLLVAGYLTLLHYDTRVPLACGKAGIVDCARVLSSPASVVAGLPVALWGLLYFAAALVLRVLAHRQPARFASVIAVMNLAGALAVVFLVYTELYVVGSICLWCTGIHVIVLSIFVIEALDRPGAGAVRSSGHARAQ